MLIDALRAQQYKSTYKTKKKTKDQHTDADLNKTLKGVLINNYKKNINEEDAVSFDEIQDSLLICETPSYYKIPEKENTKNIESSFDTKKALKPLIIGTGLLLAGCLGVSSALKKSSKHILKTQSFEHLPDLAVNMNIKQETEFALYRAIRNPNFSNILGATGVFIMTGLTAISQNFVEGAKEIWIKKKAADIEKELQEGLIDVETNSFSGKLNIVNEMLNKNVKYFDIVLNNKVEQQKSPAIFSSFLSFKGNEEQETQPDPRDEIKKNIKYAFLVGGIVASAIVIGKFSLSNLRKTAEYTNQFANNITEATIDAINKISNNGNKKDLPQIIELFKSISAKDSFITEIGKKYSLTDAEINSIKDAVAESRKTIFADAPVALGGIPKKIQYYCYIDENRGHLYNWILNPENKFTKYLFFAFTVTSSIGYLLKQGMDAIKEVTVLKENAKTELDLRKRLVDTEIRNFKAKKESAINPLIENFNQQVQSGTKSKEELKQIADNILMETKNGPPYVYN